MPSGVNPGDNAAVTSAAGAVTSNHTGLTITTEALTTAAGADYSFTLTNANVYPDSVPQITVGNGSNTTFPTIVHSVSVAAGVLTFKVRNGHASAAFNGSLKLFVSLL
jgi:hypothetical protein